MILARISKAVREQNWFAVALEFIIVILGVVIGFQVTQWAGDRAEAERRAIALERLHDEVEASIGLLERMTELYDSQNSLRTEAIERLLARDFEDMDEAGLTSAIVGVSLYPAFAPRQGVYDEIVSSGMLSGLGDAAFRDALGAYQSQANFLRGQIDYLRDTSIGQGQMGDFDEIRVVFAPGTARERRYVVDWQAAADNPDFMKRLLLGNNGMRAMRGWWAQTRDSALELCAETSRLTGAPCNPPERSFE